MANNFLDLGKKMDIQIQEAQEKPCKMNSKKSTLRHITIKLPKVKERILKASREN